MAHGFWVTLAAFALSACAATDAAVGRSPSGGNEGDGDATTSPALSACTEQGRSDFAGTYTVPVTDNELAPYATFPVDRVDFCARDDEASLDYDLPELLVGRPTRVSFRGPFDEIAGAYLLAGDDGDATCTPAKDGWTCKEQFTNLDVDSEALAKHLADLPAEEAVARRDVAQRFATDPIGELSFSQP